ncbi:PIN domain-containing protein [Burkholderia seminalis]|uniref:PIN domain-containing protein n=1 Tax=Burkholderia seminalis TaxID=488731 RepID=UPI001588C7E3|nr:PIN domain-containing protein [Burkholderia seminalis]
MNRTPAVPISVDETGAIALDTSIFDQYKGRFDSGLLRRVTQFQYGGRVKVLVPDLIRREVLAHLTSDALTAAENLEKALRNAKFAQLVSPGDADQMLNSLGDPAGEAEHRLSEWLERTGAEVVNCAARVDLGRLFDRYFAAQPPFADTATKKAEFPDAAVLMAVEHWADEHNTRVLLVSRDGDWERFCQDHPRLQCVSDLGAALSAFQDENAQFIARRFADAEPETPPPAIVEAVFNEPSKFSELITFVLLDPTWRPGLRWSHIIKVHAVNWPTASGMREFEAVDYRDGKVVVRVSLALTVELHAHFMVLQSPGSAEPPRLVEGWDHTTYQTVPIDALVTLDGGLKEKVKVDRVEFLPTTFAYSLFNNIPDIQASDRDEGLGYHAFD